MLTTFKEKWFQKGTEKAMHMLIADVAGNAADLLFLRFQNNFDQAVPIFKSSFKTSMRYPMQAIQAPLEWALGTLGGIEGGEEKEKRLNQTPEKRLDGLLDTTYHFASAAAVGYAALIATEKGLSHLRGTGHVPNKMWTRLDIPVHVGSALFLGSRMMQPVTGQMKEVLKKTMTGLGWSEEKAEQDSRFTIAYILPNYLTLIPTTYMMGSLYHAQEKGLIRPTTKQSWADKVTGGRVSKYTFGLLGSDSHGYEVMSKATDMSGAGFAARLAKHPLLGIIENPSNAKTAAH